MFTVMKKHVHLIVVVLMVFWKMIEPDFEKSD